MKSLNLPEVYVDKKIKSRCTAGHTWEWSASTINAAPVWLQVSGKKFCLRCIQEKLLELNIGQEEPS